MSLFAVNTNTSVFCLKLMGNIIKREENNCNRLYPTSVDFKPNTPPSKYF